jgi:hypothetical protein
MSARIQRFSPDDVVVDLNGHKGVILEAHQDPHPPEYAHCCGNSARYVVRIDNILQTRWDWQLTLSNAS